MASGAHFVWIGSCDLDMLLLAEIQAQELDTAPNSKVTMPLNTLPSSIWRISAHRWCTAFLLTEEFDLWRRSLTALWFETAEQELELGICPEGSGELLGFELAWREIARVGEGTLFLLTWCCNALKTVIPSWEVITNQYNSSKVILLCRVKHVTWTLNRHNCGCC